MNTCVVFSINSVVISTLDDVIIQSNDQQNTIVNKKDILSIQGNYKHIQSSYFQYL